ncbi:MAG TPA: hypothetical protein EYN46_05005, partial [Candidatus Poseidoniales archaeon]|nr:hypothetical protein [Candidatus Poseidoniales archaeon]
IVHAETRSGAIEKMINAIGKFIVMGCQTNIGFLADLLAHPAFAAGQTTTNFIDTHWPDGWANPGGEELMQTLAGCAAAAESFGLAKAATTPSDDEDAFRGDMHNPFLLINRRFP